MDLVYIQDVTCCLPVPNANKYNMFRDYDPRIRDPGPFYSPVNPGIGKVKPGIGNYMEDTQFLIKSCFFGSFP